MDSEKKQELFRQIDEVTGIYEQYNPVGEGHKFDLAIVKKVYEEMISYIIVNIDEAETLRKWMDAHDFWKTPASTRFHGNWESGLCVHTLMVIMNAFWFAKSVVENYERSPIAGKFDFSAEDIFVASLCHDFCKADSYMIEYRNTKDFMGNRVKKPVNRTRDDSRNLGHGNESVLNLIECMPSFINRRNVLEAVSRHMGFSDLTDTEKMNYSNFLLNPLVLLLQLADQAAAAWGDC